MKILIADESELIRSVLKRILTEGIPDAAILEAATGNDTCLRLSDYLPDILIIDAGGIQLRASMVADFLLHAKLYPMVILTSQFPAEDIYIPDYFRNCVFVKKENLLSLPALISKVQKDSIQ